MTDIHTRSEFFNAKYSGWCRYEHCYKDHEIELGDGCEYLDEVLMHMRCCRAALREMDK